MHVTAASKNHKSSNFAWYSSSMCATAPANPLDMPSCRACETSEIVGANSDLHAVGYGKGI